MYIPDGTNRIELAIIDYQDEGLKLEIFYFKDENFIESSTLAQGEYDLMKVKMKDAEKLVEENNIKCECIEGIERC